MLRRISLFFLLLVSLNTWAANYVLELDTSSYGYGLVNSPAGEQYQRAVDGNVDSKYLNFYKTGGGITVGFANSRIMRRLMMYTANDGNERDPMTINIYGSATYDGAKTLIQSNVATNLSTNRKTGSIIDFENNTSYQFYTIEVTSVRNATYANSFQFSEVAFYYDTEYVAGAVPQYSSGITQSQQASKTANTLLRQSQSGNEIDIEQIGDNNSITLRQGTGTNRMTVYANGNDNALNLNQGYLTDGAVSINDSNTHYLNLNLSGNSNNITTRQTNGSIAAPGHYNETTVSGNSNILNLQQQGTGGKTLFTNVNGSNNTVAANQKDAGQHYLDVRLLGNGHTVNAIQEGAGNHAATINLTNTGGSSTVNMNQLGTTAQTYSIEQSCTNPAGCSTTIIQGQ
jgi:hypothetical protein